MAANRNSKPAPAGRNALKFGWLVAAASVGHGDTEAMVWDCSRCSKSMTTYTLRGVAGRPNRFVVLAHKNADLDPTYAASALFSCCNLCNAADGTAAVTVKAVHGWAAQMFTADTRADAATVKAFTAREKAAVAAQDSTEAAESEAGRLPL